MTDPVLHVIVGPNGAGKTTLYERVLHPATMLDFVNADHIAALRWPHDALEHAYDAARLAAAERSARIASRSSFVTETVFSHESKIELLRDARRSGYRVHLHVVLVPVELSVARVRMRVEHGGHDVPETKIRERHQRLWNHVVTATSLAHDVTFYDNTVARTPFVVVAEFADGQAIGPVRWPSWTPAELRDLGST